MIKVITAILFLITSIAFSQNYQTVEELNDACSQLGFAGDEEAEIAVDAILDQLGLFRNFTIQECPGINNAVAKNIETSTGHKERYILYDAEFFSRIEDKANNNWAAKSILAHEIAHHLNGHALNNEGSNHKWELEADYFSGIALAKLGATLEDAQSAINSLKYEKATATHPAKADRLAMIAKGWNKAKGITVIVTEEESKEAEALAFFKSGEQAFSDREYISALRSFEKAKNLGNVDAYFYLATIYSYGHGVKIDGFKATTFAEEGYKLGSIPSQYLYAYFLSQGTYPLRKNEEEANRLFMKNYQGNWFKDKFKQTKHAIYAYNVSEMYYYGHGGIEEDKENSFLWAKQGAALNDPASILSLSTFYYWGVGVEKNQEKGIELYKKAANTGFALAQNNLGSIYSHGRDGFETDKKIAFFWWNKAADQNQSTALWLMGKTYMEGEIVKKDISKAIQFYESSAEQGNSDALIFVIEAYNTTLDGIVEIDVKKADYYKAKLYSHLGEPKALYETAICYATGSGVKKDSKKALSLFKKAAIKGFVKAQDFLKENGIIW